jgi:hypothetical protein
MKRWFWPLLFTSLPTLALAQGFSALVSPPRVETSIKPGQTTRHVLEVNQVGNMPGRFRVYTADWKFSNNGSLDFSQDLAPNSCRPWVALERRELTVGPNSKVRFRFEITPPADAPTKECIFAIMFEGVEASSIDQGTLSFPVSGRIGVIVYAGMPGNRADLKIIRSYVSTDSAKLPTLELTNTGTAHGRLSGLLTGTDAKGIKLEFTPLTLPVLVGETRAISLSANTEDGQTTATLNYPITLKGTLEWGSQRLPFERTFSLP